MSGPSSPRGRDREALFVRIPTSEAERLDRASFELKVSKQDLIAGLVARYVDPGSPTSLDALRALGETSGGRRVTIAAEASTTLGHHDFQPTPAAPAPTGDVLTLADAAALLQAEEDAVEALAQSGELPGRRVGGSWRFARHAILEWLAAGER